VYVGSGSIRGECGFDQRAFYHFLRRWFL